MYQDKDERGSDSMDWVDDVVEAGVSFTTNCCVAEILTCCSSRRLVGARKADNETMVCRTCLTVLMCYSITLFKRAKAHYVA